MIIDGKKIAQKIIDDLKSQPKPKKFSPLPILAGEMIRQAHHKSRLRFLF